MELLDATQVKNELVVLEPKGRRGWQLRGSAEPDDGEISS